MSNDVIALNADNFISREDFEGKFGTSYDYEVLIKNSKATPLWIKLFNQLKQQGTLS